MKGTQATKFTDPALNVVVDNGISAVRSFTVNRSVSEVFQFARSFSNLRKIMKHLDAIESIPQSFQLFDEVDNKKIAWGVKEGDEIFAYGTIEFFPDSMDRTIVRMGMKYEANKGKLAAKLHDWFGDNLEDKLFEDMRHFKHFVETGEIPSTEGQPVGHCGRS